MESDPLGLKAGNYSTYAYVGDNPVSGRDPLGLMGLDGLPGGGISPLESQGYGLQQLAANYANQAWNYLTLNLGLNAGYHQGPLGNSVEAGVAVGGNGKVCGYVTQCGTAGWGHMAAAGLAGGATVGPQACTSVTPSAGFFGAAGDGFVGGGQYSRALDGGNAGSVSFRSLFGGGAAAGAIGCVQYMKCM